MRRAEEAQLASLAAPLAGRKGALDRHQRGAFEGHRPGGSESPQSRRRGRSLGRPAAAMSRLPVSAGGRVRLVRSPGGGRRRPPAGARRPGGRCARLGSREPHHPPRACRDTQRPAAPSTRWSTNSKLTRVAASAILRVNWHRKELECERLAAQEVRQWSRLRSSSRS